MPGKEATFTPYQRTKTIAYLEEDAPEGAKPWEVTMVSDLTMDEVDEINDIRRRYLESITSRAEAGEGSVDEDADERIEKHRKAFLDSIAPYVIDWPFYTRKGEKIPPPSEGGGEMFRKVPSGVLGAVVRDLMAINLGRVDPKL